MRSDHHNARNRQQAGEDLEAPQPLAASGHCKKDREEYLNLDDQRGQSGGNMAIHCQKQQSELSGSDQ
ncbi:hypothetical protein AA11237_1676 [Acidocella aminolytica 101 = DSM 11237]|nr:hypothetical protein AA11237_1676 [Acidocella aminolytica 101 = DSM 11237]